MHRRGDMRPVGGCSSSELSMQISKDKRRVDPKSIIASRTGCKLPSMFLSTRIFWAMLVLKVFATFTLFLFYTLDIHHRKQPDGSMMGSLVHFRLPLPQKVPSSEALKNKNRGATTNEIDDVRRQLPSASNGNQTSKRNPSAPDIMGGVLDGRGNPLAADCYPNLGSHNKRVERNTTLAWRQAAVELAKLPAKDLLRKLDGDDPFGVRRFETALIRKELELGRTLTVMELRELFPCPEQCLITPVLHPGRMAAPSLFRKQSQARPQPDTNATSTFSWLFFQHLRKAGGTHFCSLAQANLARQAVSRYYCMPDYYWEHKVSCAGCLTRFENGLISDVMAKAGHRIAGNEWDNFERRFLDMGDSVVFATSFRKPLDRALSQFRFECIEGRGCKILNVTEWWERRKDLYNVYTTTFADPPRTLDKLRETYLDKSDPDQAAKRGELLARALDVVLQLHLVLTMEWLAYAGEQVTAVLGFRNVSGLTRRVRPHISQAERKDSHDTNELGAASITKASWDPKSYLSPQQYQVMSETLALDMILTDAARRIFLERLVCTNV